MPAPLDPQCIFSVLADHEVDYVLIGGLAAVLHGSTALTNDADIVPSADDANVVRVGGALSSLDARIRVADDPAGLAFDPHPALLASMAMLNMTTRCGDVDLTFSPVGIENYRGTARACRRIRSRRRHDPRRRARRHHPIEGGRRPTEGPGGAPDPPRLGRGDRPQLNLGSILHRGGRISTPDPAQAASVTSIRWRSASHSGWSPCTGAPGTRGRPRRRPVRRWTGCPPPAARPAGSGSRSVPISSRTASMNAWAFGVSLPASCRSPRPGRPAAAWPRPWSSRGRAGAPMALASPWGVP